MIKKEKKLNIKKSNILKLKRFITNIIQRFKIKNRTTN